MCIFEYYKCYHARHQSKQKKVKIILVKGNNSNNEVLDDFLVDLVLLIIQSLVLLTCISKI